MSLRGSIVTLAVVVVLSPWTGASPDEGRGGTARGPAPEENPFPQAIPESVGLSLEALNELADVVRGYVEEELIVGGELLVIKNQRTVLHEVFGWKDRENERPWEPNTLCNIRSMTKPITGAAAQLLIEEGTLGLRDPVAEYLPGFRREETKAITVEQLLTHHSGLPLTILTKADDYGDLDSMVEAIAQRGPEFEPGSRFWYSDAGSDVLGAVIARASGVSLDEFVTERLLKPLGMHDTYYPMGTEDPRWSRIAALYGGQVEHWIGFWKPEDRPFYPFAWGSQSLYGTPRDYARFLAMLMGGGGAEGRQVLSEEAVARMLTPVSAMSSLGSDVPMPTGFRGLKAYHGQMLILYMESQGVDEAGPVVFGYSGSDGTHAWAWPELEMMILYFTQSRGQASGLRLEAEIDRLLVHPGSEAYTLAVPDEYASYLGTYVANFGPHRNEEFTVLVQNGRLALDVPSQLVYELKDPDEDGRWRFALTDEIAVSFDRDESGVVTGMRIYQAGFEFELPKGSAPAEEELDPDVVQEYLGLYYDVEENNNVEVKIQGNALVVDVPGMVIFELLAPDKAGRWVLRANPGIWLTFNRDGDGRVVGLTWQMPDREIFMPRVDDE